MSKIQNVNLDNINPSPFQARGEDRTHVLTVAESILEHGLQQPPFGRKLADGKVELTFGNTRLAAHNLIRAYLDKKDLGAYTPLISDNFKKLVVTKKADEFETMRVIVFLRKMNDRRAFEAGVVENFHRKDLSIMETAHQMSQYKNLFGATSRETGLLFGQAPVTVRTYVRFTQLPDESQTALDRGEMSQDSAKKLLQVAKILPGEIRRLTHLLTSPTCKGPSDAARIINTAIQTLKPVVMWGTAQTVLVEPYVGGRGLWPQDYEFNELRNHIPSRFRKVLDGTGLIERMVEEIKTVNETDDSEYAEQMINDAWHNADESPPAELIQDFGISDHSARVISAIRRPPACADCPFRIVTEKVHRCLNRDCHKNRVKLWADLEVEKAAADLGYPILSDDDGENFDVYEPGFNDQYFKTAHDNKSDKLRVAAYSSPALQKNLFTGSYLVTLAHVRPKPEPPPAPTDVKGPNAETAPEPAPVDETGETESAAAMKKRIAKERAAERAAEQKEQARLAALNNDIQVFIYEIAAPFLAAEMGTASLEYFILLSRYVLQGDYRDYIDSSDDAETNRDILKRSIASELLYWHMTTDGPTPQNRQEIYKESMLTLAEFTGKKPSELPAPPEGWLDEKDESEESE